jgi:hypothetical protein
MANRVSVEFGASTGELKSAIDDVNSSLDSIKSHVEGVTSGLQTLAGLAGVALSFEGLKAGFDSLAKFADEIQNAQAKIGGSLESVTTLSGVATLAGVSFRSLTHEVALANLQVQKSTSDAYGPAAQGLKSLGLSAASLSGLPVDQWFAKVTDAVSRFNPSIALTSNVQKAFGAGFSELMPLLIQGSEHFLEMQAAAQKAQEGLSSALPGISETKEKLDLMGLSSRAFAAQIFTVLKPAIDAAIDGFANLTRSITVDDIRNAANAVANYLVDLAASVAKFFLEAGIQVDLFKLKLASLAGTKVTLIAEDDFPTIRAALGYLAQLSGNYDKVKDTLSKPLTIGGTEANGNDIKATLDGQLQAIQEWSKKAHDAINGAIPVAGSWQALGQDVTKLNTDVLTAAASFTKLNAAAADDGARNRVTARAVEIEEEIAAEKAKLERIKQIFTEEANSHRITQNQKALYTETAIEQAFQAEMALIAQKEKLYQGDLVKYAEVEKEKAKLTEQYQRDMLKTVEQSQKDMTATIKSELTAVTSAFNSQIRGLLAGTTSWANASKAIASDLTLHLIQKGEEWVIIRAADMLKDLFLSKTVAAEKVTSEAAAEAAKTAAAVTGAGERAAAESTGATAGIGAQLSAAITSVGIDAGKVFAGVFGFLAPLMGPAAAGPAAASEAETFAAGLAPLAVGAWEIPSVMGALLHPGEMVMPATYAQGFRNAVSGSGSGGNTQVVIAPQISAYDTTGLQAMIQRMMPQLARALQSYQNLNPSTT